MTTEHPLDDFYPDDELVAKLARFNQSRECKTMTQSAHTYGTILKAFCDAKQTDAPIERAQPTDVSDQEFGIAFALQCSHVAEEWGAKPDITDMQRAEGAIAGVLAILDGQVSGFPGATVFAPKHGDNDIAIFRDGKIVKGITDRTNYFHGGESYCFERLRYAAANYQVKEGDDG